MRIVIPQDIPRNQLVFPANARTLPPGRQTRQQRKLYLPNWVSGETAVVPSQEHGVEKPNAVVVNPDSDDPDQLPTTIIAAGTEHKDELLELGERLREEQRETKETRRVIKAEKSKQMLERAAEHIDKKLTAYKQNSVTSPDPKHVLPKNKRLY